jgi:hypothetical protein
MAENTHFAVCIRNTGNEASLELRKLYEVVSDPDAEADGMIRVIDESGEDYLFPAAFFVRTPLPAAVEEAVLHATRSFYESDCQGRFSSLLIAFSSSPLQSAPSDPMGTNRGASGWAEESADAADS